MRVFFEKIYLYSSYFFYFFETLISEKSNRFNSNFSTMIRAL